jgi:hypothetical protein
MKAARQGRNNGVGKLVLAAGMLLVLLSSAPANAAGKGAGTALTVPSVLTHAVFGVQSSRPVVGIPQKDICRSPFKPPDPDLSEPPSWGPPPWAHARVNRPQTEPPWEKGMKTSQGKAKSASAKRG